MWILFPILSGFLAAFWAILVKLYLKHLNPYFITFVFFVIGAFVLLVLELVTRKVQVGFVGELSTKEVGFLALAALCNVFAFVAYFMGLQVGKTSGVVAIDRLSILYVVIMSVLLLHEPFTYKTFLGTLCMLLGSVLLSA